jgi:hypothetical protein
MRPGHVSAALMPAAASLLALAAILAPGRVAASCADFPPLEQHLARAGVVFVGTVVAVADEKRTATVAVEEIWRGPALPAEVPVHGTFEPDAFTSVDRTFEAGTRYLFAPALADGRLQDDSCTATRPWTDELADLRPVTVATPEPIPTGDANERGRTIPVALIVGVILLGVAGTSLIAFRARPS